MSRDYNGGTLFFPGYKIDKNEFFKPLIKLLKKAVNHQTEEFDKLKGIWAFNDISEIIRFIDSELDTLDLKQRPVIQLKAIRDCLAESISETRGLYEEVKELNEVFQLIRGTLGKKDIGTEDLKKEIFTIYSDLWNYYKEEAGYLALDELKTVLPHHSLKNGIIFYQWRRLWNSHEPRPFPFPNR